MTAFIDSFYNSFTSAGPSSGEQATYAEMQLLKVTAPNYDLEKFGKQIFRLKKNVGIRVDVKAILPSRRAEERLKKMEKREQENGDFLDFIFSDTIPFLHEFLTYGTPEAQFYQIKGRKGDLDIFNKLCRQMIYSKELQCKLEVTDRRKIPVKNPVNPVKESILGGPNSEPDFLDALFTDDLSSCNPFVHNILTTVY